MLFEYETCRLVLKILRPEDASMVLDFYMRDRELFEKYEPDRMNNFYTLSHQTNLLKCEYDLAFKFSTIRFYVFLRSNPDYIIGTVCFHNIRKSYYSTCEVGYKFLSMFHHKGYASEALEKGIDVMISELGMHRICAWVHPDNFSSIRLLSRIGFEKEGICRDYLFLHGQWQDHLQYSLVTPRLS